MFFKSLSVKIIELHKAHLLLFGIFLSISTSVNAHGDLSERIEEKTIEILNSPFKAELYYERGFLYQQHEEFLKAIDDYQKSELLGFTDKLLYYRIASVYLITNEPKNALNTLDVFLKIDNIDVKAKKLEAQILYKLQQYSEALIAYEYVINTMTDVRPQDIIEYTDIILAENNSNYQKALNAIELGLIKLGHDTLSLQLKKLEYLEALGVEEHIINQYNYFIIEYNRKELWYYKKAKYLHEINKNSYAKITLEQAKVAIQLLDDRFKNTLSIQNLNEKIIALEKSINPLKS